MNIAEKICTTISAILSIVVHASLKENKWQDGMVYIYDGMGNLVRSQSFAKQTKISINISNLRQGHYKVVVNSNGDLAEGSFLKE